MDTIRYLLGVIMRLVLILFLVAFIFWLIGFLYPQFKPSSIFSFKMFSNDWLPAPKNYGLLAGNRRTDGQNGAVYVPGAPYDGYKNARYESQEGVDFFVYTASGTQIIRAKGSGGNQTWNGGYVATDDRGLYVRNLSVFQGGGITYGQRILGEARDTMFRNGSFPIYIVDADKRLVGTMQAVTTGTWAIPGWARFQATVPVKLPGNTYCSLILQSATQQIQINHPVKCY